MLNENMAIFNESNALWNESMTIFNKSNALWNESIGIATVMSNESKSKIESTIMSSQNVSIYSRRFRSDISNIWNCTQSAYNCSNWYFQLEVLYGITIILIGVFVRHATKIMRIPVPYTVTVFLVGVVFGFLPVGKIVEIRPNTIIIVFMPVLIFEGAFAIDVYVFKQIFLQVLLMAFPALVVMIGLTGAVAMVLFKFDWIQAMLFASILSATDPVAVVAIMRDLGVKKHLSLLIEGESMLNDGAAMVFFDIFHNLAKNNDEPFNFGDTLYKLVIVSTGGPAFGYLSAKIAVFWLEWTFNDSLIEILITLVTSYLTFYIAEEFLDVSGILAVVTCGVIISGQKTCISPEVEAFLHSFWETLSFMANTLIFALSGLIISQKVLHKADPVDIIRVVIIYVMVHVIRGITIFIFSPILRRLGYGMTWQEGLVATWSGLRGAIGLALSLLVFLDWKGPNNVGNLVLFHVSLIVVLTLFINATTISTLLRFLGLSGVTEDSRKSMKKAIVMLDKGRARSMVVWKIDRFLSNSNWNVVKSLCTIKDPYSKIKATNELIKGDKEIVGPGYLTTIPHEPTTANEVTKGDKEIVCPSCHTTIPQETTPKEVHKMKSEAVRKYLKLFQKAIWEQFEHGTLSGYGVQRLDDMIEHAYDTDLQTISVRMVKALWKMPRWMERLQRMVVCIQVTDPGKDVKHNTNDGAAVRAYRYWRSHWLLLVIIYGMQSVVSLLGSSLYFLYILEGEMEIALDNALWAVMTVSIIFFLFRICVFRMTYIKTPWFGIALLCCVVFILDFIGETVLFDRWFKVKFDQSVLWTMPAQVQMWRTLYSVPILEVLNTFVIYLITKRKLSLLREFYDVAWAYVNAVEKVVLNIGHVIDNEQIRANIIQRAQNAKMDLIRELGLVQGFYPTIAIEAKTSHTIRSVLNAMRDTVYDLRDEGRIDEAEGSIFIKVIESKMKRLLAKPPKIKEPSVSKILAGVSWIDNDKDILHFLKLHGTLISYKSGTTIVHAGDKSDGIFIIISGLVKIESYLMNFTNFLTTGNVVGEMSCLTLRPRSATLVCETPVKVMYLSSKNVDRIIDQFSYLDPPLGDRLWRMTAIRIASTILTFHTRYQGISKEALLGMLEDFELEFIDSEIVDLRRRKDVMLITGTATGFKTEFLAPCYVDSEVKRLIFECLLLIFLSIVEKSTKRCETRKRLMARSTST